MESKRMVMFVTVMVLGSLLIQTEAQATPYQPSDFGPCYAGCLLTCALEKKFPGALLCPLTCVKTCLLPQVPVPPQVPMPPPAPVPTQAPVPSPTSPMASTNEINHADYYCKLGCATNHCLSLSSVQNPNVDKVVECVNSCSDKCTAKN